MAIIPYCLKKVQNKIKAEKYHKVDLGDLKFNFLRSRKVLNLPKGLNVVFLEKALAITKMWLMLTFNYSILLMCYTQDFLWIVPFVV